MAFLAKRKFPREVRRDGVKIVSDRGIEYGTYEDISAGGLKLTLDRPAEIGEKLDIEFRPQSGESEIQMPVQVVRSIKVGKLYEVGVLYLRSYPRLIRSLESSVDPKQGPF